MKKKYTVLVFVFVVLAFAQYLPCKAQVELVDVAVTAIDIGGSGAGDINAWLISQQYHAPRVGVPWLKLNSTSGDTVPLVSVLANVTRADSNYAAPIVLVDVLFYALSSATPPTSWDFLLTRAVQLAPGESVLVGPATISVPSPFVANWTLGVYMTVTSGEANINPSPNYVDTWFYMLGYCDLNRDNVADGKDFVLVKKAMPSTPGSEKWYWPADVNNSGSCTAADFQLVKTNVPTVYTPA